MSSNKIHELAKKFVIKYLQTLRYLASLIPRIDRGLFPFYWFRPVRIEIVEAVPNDLAISIIRPVSGKKDRIRIIQKLERIERTQFPNLDYTKWPLFHLKENTHFSSIGYLTASVGYHPFITLSKSCDIKIKQVRVEASVKGYPRVKEFLWFFTYPNLEYLTIDIAEKSANEDFWSYISWYVSTKLHELLSRRVQKATIALFRKAIEDLRHNYLSLISREDLEEQMLQQFLENHYYLLSPDKTPKLEKRKLGPYIPDFILKFNSDLLTLVEIQLNRDPIIINNKPSSGLKEAIKQLNNWFEWIQENDPSSLCNFNGLIVIGRKENHQKYKRTISKILSELKYPVTMKTYDELGEAIDYILSKLVAN